MMRLSGMALAARAFDWEIEPVKRKHWVTGAILGVGLALSAGVVSTELAARTAPAPMPQVAMQVPAVNKALRTLLKDDYATYAAMMAEPGKGKTIGPDYYGSTCLKGNCEEGYATLFIEGGTRAVYVAWTQGGKLFFRPAIEKWPKKAEMAYEFWPEN